MRSAIIQVITKLVECAGGVLFDIMLCYTDIMFCIVVHCSLLCRYRRNTTIFPFTKKSYPHTRCEDTIFIFHL